MNSIFRHKSKLFPRNWKFSDRFLFQANRKSGSSSEKKLKTDLELQESYQGFFPRFKAIYELIGRSDGIEKLTEFQSITSRNGGVETKIFPMVLYADMQNPLLKRYEFDLDDFLDGAEKAFYLVSEGLSSVELGNYATGYFLSAISILLHN
jgi:hypothetical protein